MVNCVVYGCKNRTKNKSDDEKFQRIGFFVIPKVIASKCPKTAELSAKRRALWFRRIRRKDLNESATYYRVCGAHFIGGRPAYVMDETNPDWAPCLNLGYKSSTLSRQCSNERHKRFQARQRLKTALSATQNAVRVPKLPKRQVNVESESMTASLQADNCDILMPEFASVDVTAPSLSWSVPRRDEGTQLHIQVAVKSTQAALKPRTKSLCTQTNDEKKETGYARHLCDASEGQHNAGSQTAHPSHLPSRAL